MVKFGLAATILENSCELSKSKMGKSFRFGGKSFHCQGHLFTPENADILPLINSIYFLGKNVHISGVQNIFGLILKELNLNWESQF